MNGQNRGCCVVQISQSLLVLVCCVFTGQKSVQLSARRLLEHFMFPSADQCYGDADFIWHLPTLPKAPMLGFRT